jgi:hypothetical protein
MECARARTPTPRAVITDPKDGDGADLGRRERQAERQAARDGEVALRHAHMGFVHDPIPFDLVADLVAAVRYDAT